MVVHAGDSSLPQPAASRTGRKSQDPTAIATPRPCCRPQAAPSCILHFALWALCVVLSSFVLLLLLLLLLLV